MLINLFFKMLSIKNLICIALFAFWATNFTTAIYYIVFLFLSFFVICRILLNPFLIFYSAQDKIAISFILVWIYGIILGLIRGNPIQYVCANFAGMICYMSYFYFVQFKCKLYQLTKIVLLCGIILSLYSIIRLFSFLLGFNISADVGISSTGQLRVYFSTLSIVYALLGGSFYLLLNRKIKVPFLFLNKSWIVFAYFILAIFALFFVASSKGFMLGGLFIIGIIPLCLYIRSLIHGRINPNLFGILFLFFIIVVALFYFDYFSIIENMFDGEDSSNSVRYEQLVDILNDCSFIGRGLGASVPNVVRSEEGPYGFELTFINLIHKFGFLSIILFFNWIYMFTKLIQFVFLRKSTFYSIIALSSLGYMFPSIGNPLLMHPSLVILNCLTLYFIKIIDYSEKNICLHGNI